jgi:hypothetical protein
VNPAEFSHARGVAKFDGGEVNLNGHQATTANGRDPLTPQALRAWLVDAGFAERHGGRLVATFDGLQVAAALDRHGPNA